MAAVRGCFRYSWNKHAKWPSTFFCQLPDRSARCHLASALVVRAELAETQSFPVVKGARDIGGASTTSRPARMINFRAANLTYEKIAAVLNAEALKPRKAAKFYASVVQDILKAHARK